MKTIKCFGCGKEVPISHSQNVMPHKNGAQDCIISGQPARKVKHWNEIPTDFHPPRKALAERYKRKKP